MFYFQGHKNPKKLCKENLQTEQDCAAFVEQIIGSDDYDNVLYPMSECEKSVEQLVKDMGQAKFDICVSVYSFQFSPAFYR